MSTIPSDHLRQLLASQILVLYLLDREKHLSELRSARSSNLPSQTIPNLRGNASAVTLRSGKALPQPAP
ncbi:hypothetical protein CR513_23530, partial [Mucuna pruriens]